MSEEWRAEEFKYIEEELLGIIQIIDTPLIDRDDVYKQLGKIYVKAEFALDHVKRLKDEA